MNFYERSTLVKIGHDSPLDTQIWFKKLIDTGTNVWKKMKQGSEENERGWKDDAGDEILLRKLRSLHEDSTSGPAIYKSFQ